jgi:competence ComEA-like helix-hairpin-helix protein
MKLKNSGSMWKDWFAFSRREQHGIVFLALLMVLFLGFRLILPSLIGTEKPRFTDDSSIVWEESKETETGKERNNGKTNEKQAEGPKSVPAFDPNKVSVTFLDEMDVASYAIVNWMKYLESGGTFEHPRDIRKIYGLDSAKARQLEYSAEISGESKDDLAVNSREEKRLDAQENRRSGETQSSGPFKDSGKKSKFQENSLSFPLNINEADPSELERLPGIGTVYAKRIVAFRELLGGFFSVDQLSEVYGLSEETLESLRHKVKVREGPYRKIPVNSASLREMKKHPYLDFYKARDIIEFRKKHGSLTGKDQLQRMPSFSSKEVPEILPYLSFE